MASAPERTPQQLPPAAPASRGAALADAQGRVISYLRVSLTDRCNFKCTYCSPADVEDDGGLLRREELARLFRVFAALGVRRIRLTGGEPTLRRDLVEIVAAGRASARDPLATFRQQRMGMGAREVLLERGEPHMPTLPGVEPTGKDTSQHGLSP